MTAGPPPLPPQVVQPQPSPLSWWWEQIPGIAQDTPDSRPRAITLIRLHIYHVTGSFVGHFQPEDLQKLADQAAVEARKAASGLVIASQLPPDRQGNGGR
jgi:hypothetical protein